MISNRRLYLYVARAVPIYTLILGVFVGALVNSRTGEIATALATVIGGSFVLIGATVAWKAVQDQIEFQQTIEKDKRKGDRRALENALTSELLVFSRSIIDGTSMWNVRAHNNPTEVPSYFPKLLHPTVCLAVIPQIGILEEGWPAMAVVTFYGNVLELNEIAFETLRGRPTTGQDNATIARRFQMMALNLEQALDGLNSDRKFPLIEINSNMLFNPAGVAVGKVDAPPSNLQSLLAALGGRVR